MLCFEVLRSFDLDLIGEHQLFFNRVTLSPHEHSTLILQDPELTFLGMIFELSESGILVNTLPVSQFYLSNGKKISGTKLHNTGDRLAFGSTELVFKNWKYEHADYMEPLEKRYQKASQQEQVGEVLAVLEKELLELESKQ